MITIMSLDLKRNRKLMIINNTVVGTFDIEGHGF